MRMGVNKSGFSLIEVSLAIFVISSGMLIMFSLFPAGLRQVETAQSSTQEALFADYLLSTLRAEAMQMPSSHWSEITRFQDILHGITGRRRLNYIETIRYPEGVTEPYSYIRYVLSITDGGGGLRSVYLWCQSGQYGATDMAIFKSSATKFYTELIYSGMP